MYSILPAIALRATMDSYYCYYYVCFVLLTRQDMYNSNATKKIAMGHSLTTDMHELSCAIATCYCIAFNKGEVCTIPFESLKLTRQDVCCKENKSNCMIHAFTQ